MIERRGRVDVIREDVTVSGTYLLAIEDDRTPPTARGTARFFDNAHLIHRALAVERVLLCIDGSAEIEVSITVFVPGESFIAFTCADVSVLLSPRS